MAQVGGGTHDHVFDLGIGIGPVVLRVALLAAVPVVAGYTLLSLFLPTPTRTTALWVVGTAGGVVMMELLVAGGLSVPVQVVPLLLGMLAVALYAVRSTDPRFAPLRAVLRRLAPWVLLGCAAAALLEFGRGWSSTGAVALHTGTMLAMVGLAWFILCRPRHRSGRLAVRGTAAVLAVALIGGAAQAIVLRPRETTPGMAAAGLVGGVAVTIVPNLPGWNLVHVPAGAAEVGTAPDRLVAATNRPGTTGTWAAVRLPAGRAELWVRHRGELDSMTTDTGSSGAAPAELLGQDGPECASAILGAVLAAGGPALPDCPAGELTGPDAEALRAAVAVLAERGHRSLTVIGDATARGVAAGRTVRAAMATEGLADTRTAGGPVLVVAGWPATAALVRDRTDGAPVYLAPWLLTDPLLTIDAQVTPSFSPGDEAPRRYVLALRRGFPGEVPSAAGYRTWLAGQRETGPSPVRIDQVTPAVDGWPALATVTTPGR